jgi:hypothetical protein
MGWSVYGDSLLTTDLDGTNLKSQKVRFNKNVILKAIRAWFVHYNDPVYTSLYFRIYSDNNGVPGKLLYTSTNVILKSEYITLANGIKEAYWEFDCPAFKDTDFYHFVPIANGYTGTVSSHLAWKKAWPDPVYRTGLTIDATSQNESPFDIYFIGDEL